jgi:hypothetical protein
MSYRQLLEILNLQCKVIRHNFYLHDIKKSLRHFCRSITMEALATRNKFI